MMKSLPKKKPSSLNDSSKNELGTCHPDLQRVIIEASRSIDILVIEGVRSYETQKKFVKDGVSKTMKSKHLKQVDGFSHAVDVAVLVGGRIPWDDHRYFYFMAGHVFSAAERLNVSIRWGGNWDGDQDFSDQRFNDLVHFELVSPVSSI